MLKRGVAGQPQQQILEEPPMTDDPTCTCEEASRTRSRRNTLPGGHLPLGTPPARP